MSSEGTDARPSERDARVGARSALITGLAGQDGSFLAELLLARGYGVTGTVRSSAAPSLGCAEHLRERVSLARVDLLDASSLRVAIEQAAPTEIYHLAAPSSVPASWDAPGAAFAEIAGSTAAVLEAVRDLDTGIRVFVAASGAMFGDAGESPQREDTVCRPASPYAIAKLASHELVGAMRERDGLHASSGILYNHESERRPQAFVTRKITHAAASISLGLERELTLGDLGAVRDWSFAGDVMRGAWLMLQQDSPEDYVLASGVGRTVADFARAAFACVDLDADEHIRVDEALIRKREGTANVGDPARARAGLGWEPEMSFEELVKRMVQADVRLLSATAQRG
jgi:GDPmannose 4,6-dehydratase